MKRVLSFWDEDSKMVFLVTAVAMIITHGFCFANLMYSHDSLRFNELSGVDKVALGRWLYPILVHLRKTATPWMIGVISIIYISLAVVLVVKILEFNRIQGICVTMLFSTSVTLTSLFCTYIFDADADCLALLLAVFSVYAFKYFPKYINVIVSSIAIALCLALYQAYICVAIGLFLVLIIYKAKDIKNWKDVLNVSLIGVGELMALIIGAILYIISMHVMSDFCGVELDTGYNGAGKLSSLTLGMVLYSIPRAYVYFFGTFLNGYNTNVMRCAYIIMLMLLIASIIVYIVNNRPFWGSIVITIPCVLIMPLALNAIYLVSFGTLHQLMIFAFGLSWLGPFIFLNITEVKDADYNKIKYLKSFKKLTCVILVCIISFIGVKNAIYANGAYTYKKLVYDNTSLHAQTIWKDVNSIEGYVEGETQVVFMGSFANSKAAYKGNVGEKYNGGQLTGASTSAITYDGTEGQYFYAILGREMTVSCNDPNVQENDEYENMPVYPSNGYCQMIDGRVIVKLS